MLKMQDRVWKHMKVLTKSRMLWVAQDSVEGLGDTLALWIYWTRRLCLYRVRIMESLAQKMSTENDISGNATKAAYIEPEMFSWSAAVQYPEALVFVMFVLRHFSETYNRYRKNEIYKQALHPAEGNGEGNVLWGFDFKILPTGVYGADCDVLKHTQEAGGANGHTPAHSLYI